LKACLLKPKPHQKTLRRRSWGWALGDGRFVPWNNPGGRKSSLLQHGAICLRRWRRRSGTGPAPWRSFRRPRKFAWWGYSHLRLPEQSHGAVGGCRLATGPSPVTQGDKFRAHNGRVVAPPNFVVRGLGKACSPRQLGVAPPEREVGGRRDSNPQQPESQSGALPLSYGHHRQGQNNYGRGGAVSNCVSWGKLRIEGGGFKDEVGKV
jgi:hypothetical protein